MTISGFREEATVPAGDKGNGGKVWVERLEGLWRVEFFGILPLRRAQGQDDGRNL